MDEDDSVLKSILAQVNGGHEECPRVTSDASTRQIGKEKRRSVYKAASRPSSGVSFAGFESFDEVRRGFEFSDELPAFWSMTSISASPMEKPQAEIVC